MKTDAAVLVIRGSHEDARRFEQELRHGGFEPLLLSVHTQEALIQALADRTWDLVLVQTTPPHSTLREVVRLLRERELDPAIIAITNSLGDDAVVTAMKAGAHECVFRANLLRLASAAGQELAEAERRHTAREAGRRQAEAERRYRMLVDEIPALTYLAATDAFGSRLWVSPQIEPMTGFTQAHWLADPLAWSRQILADDQERVLSEYRRCAQTGEPFNCEYRVQTREGRVVWWRDEGRLIRDWPLPPACGAGFTPAERAGGLGGAAPGTPQLNDAGYVRGLIVDVTERKEAQEALRRLTYRDALTGLPNRALLAEHLHQVLHGAERPLALLIMDLDRFRNVNNTLGQQHGDHVLQEVARRLVDLIGHEESVARLRGDEFGIVLPDADAVLAAHVAAKILKALQQPFMVERLPIEVGASIGIAVSPAHGTDADLLLRRADLAMQAAKKELCGLLVYSPECDPYNPLSLVLLSELRRALEADELMLHYQPKVDLRTSSVIGAEALLRWRHPRRGLVPPDQFIGLAEEGGLIKPLTKWVLQEAVSQCDRWRRAGTRLPVSVNISARNLQDPYLVEQVTGLLEDKHLAPRFLELEITEGAMMADPPRAAHTLQQLHQQGIDLAVDDFGTGYSSLVYLRRLPVSQIKIDKSFVLGMAADNDEDAVIVRSTNDLGHNLGLKVVAEGVEDRRTLDQLTSFGCDAAQGFYMGAPMAASELGAWLRQSPWGTPAA